jgi:hypothetical protein
MCRGGDGSRILAGGSGRCSSADWQHAEVRQGAVRDAERGQRSDGVEGTHGRRTGGVGKRRVRRRGKRDASRGAAARGKGHDWSCGGTREGRGRRSGGAGARARPEVQQRVEKQSHGIRQAEEE